jgi:hypothetical protein
MSRQRPGGTQRNSLESDFLIDLLISLSWRTGHEYQHQTAHFA